MGRLSKAKGDNWLFPVQFSKVCSHYDSGGKLNQIYLFAVAIMV